MKKNWILPTPPPQDKIEQISKSLGTSQITAEVLITKGYTTPEQAYKFLNPKIEDLHDPFLMPKMNEATDRIIQAIKSHEKILIYGDYDVDGTTGSALLYSMLKNLGITPEIYIPNRLKEGYGLTKKGIEHWLKSYVNLIITVDCGISAVEEVDLLQTKGIDVIITDHHEPPAKLPEAFAILNPKVNGYPFDELCGCAIIFKLCQAIYEKLGLQPKEILNYLDLVALATVCDITPLVGENRILVNYGMKLLKNTKNAGLQSLLRSSGLKDCSLGTYHLGFILGPRINAQGRLDEAKNIVTLLTTGNRGEADKIAQKLEEENKKRQQIQDEILQDALNEIEKLNLKEKKAIIFAKERWHPGVIGIVASKIQEKFYRPTILIAIQEEIGKGSARSIPKFHLYDALSKCKEHLLQFGGHKSAAGFTIRSKNIDGFKEKFEAYASSQLKSGELMPKFLINKEINIQQINENLINELLQFAPFGLGNPKPTFLTKGVQVVGHLEVIKKSHMKFRVRANKEIIKAIGFGLVGGPTSIPITGQYINLIYELDEENYLGRTESLLKVKDIELL